MHQSTELRFRFFRLFLTVSMTWIWTGGVNLQKVRAADPTVNQNKPDDSATTDPKQSVDRVKRYFQSIEAVRRDIPHETFDLAAMAKSLGNDPAVAVAWVRDHTAWVPYRGALRGPLGVLMDRRGNSLDRATLLAELLRINGKTVRLVHAELPDETASKLSESMRFLPQEPLLAPPIFGRDTIDKIVKAYGDPFGLNAKNLRRAADELITQSERTTEEIVGRSLQQSSTLSEMVWNSKTAIAGNNPPAANGKYESKQLVESVRDHWWVQVSEGENWIDLEIDPVVKHAPSDKVPVQHVRWEAKERSLPLDSDLCQEIELRVVIEKWDAGKVSEQIVLRQPVRPAEVMGQYVGVSHHALSWPGDLDLSKEANPTAKVKSLALDQHEWLPTLTVGKILFYEGSFTDVGGVNPKADLGLFKKTGKAISGVAGAAADILGGGDGAVLPHGILTAEWLEYEIRIPGQVSRRIRRQIFDLLGAASRGSPGAIPEPTINDKRRLERSLTLIGQTEILMLPCQLSPAFVDEMMARNALMLRDPLIQFFGAPTDAAATRFAEASAKLPPLPSRLYDVTLARQSLNPSRADMYLDQPNILTCHHFLRDDPQKGLLFAVGIDIVANEMAIRPDIGSEKMRQANIVQGVLDTNVETLLMDESARIGTVSDQLAIQPDGEQWLVVHDPNDPTWQKANVSKETRARIDADLKQGYAVVVSRGDAPAGAAAFGWWRIEPRTGQTLGMNGIGWGATMAEYALVGFVVNDACILGAAAAGKLDKKAVVVCALAGLGFALSASAGATAFTLKLVLAGAASGGAVGGAL